MIRWRAGVVREELARWPGAAEHRVELEDHPGSADPDEAGASSGSSSGTSVRALSYTDLMGEVGVGDRVLLNTSALQRGLGTGGLALVVGLADRVPPDPPSGPGHLVKARYTPTQAIVLGVDDQESQHHDAIAAADDLAGMPVIVADLHSALPAILVGLRHASAEAGAALPRVVYLMSDGGALPLAFSRLVAGLNEAGWLAGTITTGQAYGGDLEAVTTHTGLLAARTVLEADVAIVAQGPGNLGTGTAWGFSGVAAGEALNATHALGGRGVAALRISEADARPRHQGISHHSLTAYSRVNLSPARVPVPELGGALGAKVQAQAAEMRRIAGPRLQLQTVPVQGLLPALRACPVPLRTMGRGLDQDAAAFLASAAAGADTATLLQY
ncbi:DUF3866 family protein [Dermacoccaceae bacterium W4C1]